MTTPHPCAASKEALADAEEDVAIEMGYSPVDLGSVPQAIRDYCQQNDFHILQAQPGVVHARSILNHNTLTSSNLPASTASIMSSVNVPVSGLDSDGFSSFRVKRVTVVPSESTPEDHEVPTPVSPLVTPGATLVDKKDDCLSLSSDSTDWEREYSVDPSTTAEIENLVRDSTLENVTATPPTSADHTPADLRWYVVYVGREPGVIQGVNTMLANIEGIPRNHSFRVPSESVGKEIFMKAVEEGKVVQVQTVRQEKRLTLADIASP
ncbi:hypothetical protein H0H93_015934 [Arthromyces matolae]|nr:hypothetical protein H0H93_015934 [Arthromyces matolae]